MKEDYVFAQFTTKMTEKSFDILTGNDSRIDNSDKKRDRAAGKAMILCLDKSGSMSGKPFIAL